MGKLLTKHEHVKSNCSQSGKVTFFSGTKKEQFVGTDRVHININMSNGQPYLILLTTMVYIIMFIYQLGLCYNIGNMKYSTSTRGISLLYLQCSKIKAINTNNLYCFLFLSFSEQKLFIRRSLYFHCVCSKRNLKSSSLHATLDQCLGGVMKQRLLYTYGRLSISGPVVPYPNQFCLPPPPRVWDKGRNKPPRSFTYLS